MNSSEKLIHDAEDCAEFIRRQTHGPSRTGKLIHDLVNAYSDAVRDAKRFHLILDLSRHEIDELNPQAKAVWDRLIKGGWYTDDLIQMIDNLMVKPHDQ